MRPRIPALIFDEYLAKPEATVKAWRNLWFHTGDAAVRDENGVFCYIDRMGDRIRVRGENISGFHIEELLGKHPSIDLAAVIAVPSAEGDEEVATRRWFNTPAFPIARFASTGVKALGSDAYEVAGKLTIKGTTKDVVVPASFTPQGDTGVFEGSLTIQRGDFSIGEGAWKAFDIVANDVVITFRIVAAAD